MKFRFISNACGVFTSGSGYTVLTDPWLDDGVFDGSWCHFPVLETRMGDLQEVDGVYLSHIHADHYDERFFDFRRDMPIFLLDNETNYLIGKLRDAGYQNLILIKDGETVDFKDFRITLFAPFVKNRFYEDNAEVGNIIDSAMVIENENLVAINLNDNTPNLRSSRMLKERFGPIDLLMHNYNNAGPYPSCFDNLTDAEKLSEHHANLQRNFEFMFDNVQEIQPKYTLPFAGSYVLGGRLHTKNRYLGTTTWDDCAEYLRSKENIATNVICLRENDVFNLKSGQANKPYSPVDLQQMTLYIEETLSKMVYPYEEDEAPDLSELELDLSNAIKRMLERANRVGINPDCNVVLEYAGREKVLVNVANPKADITCSIDERLLRRVLSRESHWNDAEIGCHISFVRQPNYYSPDIHTMLQFLHI